MRLLGDAWQGADLRGLWTRTWALGAAIYLSVFARVNTAAGGEHWLRDGTVMRVMRGVEP